MFETDHMPLEYIFKKIVGSGSSPSSKNGTAAKMILAESYLQKRNPNVRS